MSGEAVDEVEAVLHPARGRARGNGLAPVRIDREAECLGGRFMLARVVVELVMLGTRGRAARPLQVPAAEDARGRVHVRLRVIAHADREQFHDLAAEVLLGRRLRVRPTVEPHQHRRVPGDVDQDVAEVAERVFAQHLDLAAHLTGILRRLGGQIPRRFRRSQHPRNLVVAGREMVVPEERHLLLQRTTAVHHAEQPPLTRVDDVRLGEKLAAGGGAHVAGCADPGVDLVRQLLVVDEGVDRLGDAEPAVEVQFVGPRAKARSAQKMFDLLRACHGAPEFNRIGRFGSLQASYTNRTVTAGRVSGGNRRGWRHVDFEFGRAMSVSAPGFAVQASKDRGLTRNIEPLGVISKCHRRGTVG